MAKCKVGARSSHSKCASATLGWAAMVVRTWWAMARSCKGSGPSTRNATGQATGGPNKSPVTRTLASGNSPSAMRSRSSAITRSRSTSLWVTAISLAKPGFGGSGLAEMKKRGAPAPT